MSEPIHPAAIHHLPPFVTAPGETDVLLVAMAIFLLVAVVGIGVFYFKLHALPEQMAHRGQKIQFEIVAVLALLALFTHNHAFWVAGLLLALVPLPDFTTPLSSIAASLERIAGKPEAAPSPSKSAAAPTAATPAEASPSQTPAASAPAGSGPSSQAGGGGHA
ncbi:hypothetical protein [Thiocapsa marina]|uniref:Uncharacterized protein n=1 Tax=Thiocapsa marina 5811 TaxID=768671 RepID=F9UI14_9GAMM|nr:hypothetical protein [Thiocapsa marina]EGV16190.1 hypothetical protein ThimaDRAFT_4567 [Thiocapsa marina 5811]